MFCQELSEIEHLTPHPILRFPSTGPVGNWRFVSLPQGESIWERTSVQIHRVALTRHRNGLMRMIAFWKARTMDVWSC